MTLNKEYISKEEDYSETNKHAKEEFARDFIKAYDGALKRIMRGERGKDAMSFIQELKNEVAKDVE